MKRLINKLILSRPCHPTKEVGGKVFRFAMLLIAFSFHDSKAEAQASFGELEKNKIMFPSPTAASLGKYGEFPVTLYNGLVNIGQDIVTVKSGRLNLNVSLSYHAGGNRPSDIPGWVGLGFSLNAGGVISRVIKDVADDKQGGYYANNQDGQALWNSNPTSQFVEQYLSGATDPRSDVYQINFCGRSGEFIFDWDRKIHFKQLVPYKVEVLYGPGGFNGFEITTDDGVKYTFDQAEHSQISFQATTTPASSWYLTKISNLSGDIILLKYTAPSNKYRYKQYATRKEVLGGYNQIAYGGSNVLTGVTVNQNTSMDEVIYLDEIDFNNGKLFFGKTPRTDPYFVPSGINPANAEEQKLDLITLKDNSNSVIKRWKFVYFENNSERLKLKDLIVQGSDLVDVQKYSFEYNPLKLPLPLPGPNPENPYLCNNVDYWGYYNGATNGQNRIPKMYLAQFDQFVGSADREVNPVFVRAEMLEKIVFPTGGYTQFEYESNDYSVQGDSYAADMNPLISRQDLTESYEMLYDRAEGGFETDPATVSFTLTEPTHVNVRYSCGADGPQHAWADPGSNYEHDLQLQAGTYTLQSLLNTSALSSPYSADITRATGYVVAYKKGAPMPLTGKIGPGLRIKTIKSFDGIQFTSRSFEYKTGNIQNQATSSGYLSTFPAYYASLQSFASNLAGTYVTSDPINDVGEGAPIGYSRVVERFQDNSFIVHDFRGYEDYPDETMPFLNGYSSPKLAHKTSNDFQRGLETNTNYYNSDAKIQKEVINSFDIMPGSDTDVECIELKPTLAIAEYAGGPESNIWGVMSSHYYLHSCFQYNSVRLERTYDKNGQHPVSSTVVTSYNNVKHLQPSLVATTNSEGGNTYTASSFPDDYAPGEPFIDYLVTHHLSSYPVEQVEYKETNNNYKIVSGAIITYKTTGAGLPEQLLKMETESSILQSNFKFSNRSQGLLPGSGQPTQFNPDVRYEPVMTFMQYDSKGNLLESKGRNGITTSYLWGYNQEYPVAQIVGASYATSWAKINNSSMLSNPTTEDALRMELNNLRAITGAQITTHTFAPQIGVTSETDMNGKTMYYEYDSFKRLSVVRDKDHNILKKYCYHFSNQTGTCPL